jgi:predicted ArsR family transcriptional regulator
MRSEPTPSLEQRLLAVLADGTPRTHVELAAAVGVHRIGVKDAIERLTRRGQVTQAGGKVVRVSSGAQQWLPLWALTPEGLAALRADA